MVTCNKSCLNEFRNAWSTWSVRISVVVFSLCHIVGMLHLCRSWYFYGHCSSELQQLEPSLKLFSSNTRFSANSHHLTVQLPNSLKSFYSSSFFPRTFRLWNSLPSTCFPCEYELQAFKCNVNRHLSSSVWFNSSTSFVAPCLVVASALQGATYLKKKKTVGWYTLVSVYVVVGRFQHIHTVAHTHCHI